MNCYQFYRVEYNIHKKCKKKEFRTREICLDPHYPTQGRGGEGWTHLPVSRSVSVCRRVCVVREGPQYVKGERGPKERRNRE